MLTNDYSFAEGAVELVVALVPVEVFDSLSEHREREHEHEGGDRDYGRDRRDRLDRLDDGDEQEVDVRVPLELLEQRLG